MTDAPTRADRLVAELRDHCGLGDVDAHRAAFCALALARGWPKARIGRYLGISRARVGQKAEKLQDYAHEHAERMPTLTRALTVADSVTATPSGGPVVEFSVEDWSDLSFAAGLCEIVSR